MVRQKRIDIIRTGSAHKDFKFLAGLLDSELSERYGIEQVQYDRHNKIEPIETAIVGYSERVPVACGCFKAMDSQTIEIKRLFVSQENRKKGSQNSY